MRARVLREFEETRRGGLLPTQLRANTTRSGLQNHRHNLRLLLVHGPSGHSTTTSPQRFAALTARGDWV